jgi:hypothetical protein
MRNCAILIFANKQDMARVRCARNAACLRSPDAHLQLRGADAARARGRAQSGAIKPRELIPLMGVDKMKGRKWHVQGTIATTGEGLYEGLDWLSSTLKALHRSGQHTSVGDSKVVARVK